MSLWENDERKKHFVKIFARKLNVMQYLFLFILNNKTFTKNIPEQKTRLLQNSRKRRNQTIQCKKFCLTNVQCTVF